jgi:hypothetical protein
MHLSSDLSTLIDSFTTYNYFLLDQLDREIGSGGVLLLPDQPGSVPRLVLGAGKDGRAFMMDRDHLGGYTKGGPDNVLQEVQMGRCYCGPAYFVGSDGRALLPHRALEQFVRAHHPIATCRRLTAIPQETHRYRSGIL